MTVIVVPLGDVMLTFKSPIHVCVISNEIFTSDTDVNVPPTVTGISNTAGVPTVTPAFGVKSVDEIDDGAGTEPALISSSQSTSYVPHSRAGINLSSILI